MAKLFSQIPEMDSDSNPVWAYGQILFLIQSMSWIGFSKINL